MNAAAILVAAGRGERLGAKKPKAFLELGGQSLLLRSARAFQAAPSVDAIVAVVPREMKDEARGQLAALAKVSAVVAGAETRQDSVLAGLRALPRDFPGIVLIHDAARPFASVDLIERVAAAARERGAALPVVPVSDTIKRLHGSQVAETVDRSTLAAAQTPQGFRFALLLEAYEDAARSGAVVTDESMAVERLGAPVFVVEGSACNRKITTAEDLGWAQAFVSGGGA